MKNFGMEEPEQYMASKGRPRHGTWISTSAHQLHCHVERKRNISGNCSFCGIKNDLRFASLRMTMCCLFCVAGRFANPWSSSVIRFVTIRAIRVLNLGMSQTNEDVPAIGVIGGSGLYQMEELRD